MKIDKFNKCKMMRLYMKSKKGAITWDEALAFLIGALFLAAVVWTIKNSGITISSIFQKITELLRYR